MKELQVRSKSRKQVLDITADVEDLMASLLEKHPEGALLLFCQHTTAALTVNENADPTVKRDFLQHCETLVPRDAGFIHGEGNSDAHIQCILTGPSLLLPVSGGRLALGVWQGIYFCEFDGPRTRRVQCQLLPALI
ncbi:MAG: secondary thiamine-phosphate synthase enzyme YjbQ [Spirochaetota bacterium]